MGRRRMATGGARSDRGAILIHVAVALLALMSVTMFVADYGVFWLSRRQAQNAADAAALAAAVAVAYDDGYPASPLPTGPALQAAASVAALNPVFGEAPALNLSADGGDVFFVPCPDGSSTCIRVNVLRDLARGNPLPAFFGDLVGKTTQGTRATATAQAGAANSTDCLKPFGLPDRWDENTPSNVPFAAGQTFAPGDGYVAPGPTGPGTGFAAFESLGTELRLTQSENPDVVRAFTFVPLELPTDGCTGGFCYRTTITSCAGGTLGNGDGLPRSAASSSDTLLGVSELIGQDPGADWDASAERVVGSCVDTGTCPGRRFSPRVIAIPLLNPELMLPANDQPGVAAITNIMALFVDRIESNEIVGYIVRAPGLVTAGKTEITPETAFLKSVVLVR